MSEFNIGDNVRVTHEMYGDRAGGIFTGMIGKVVGTHDAPSIRYVKFDGIDSKGHLDRDGARYMNTCQLEQVPFEIPASPFYVAAFGGFTYKVEVDGLFYSLTCLENGSHWPRHAETRKIPGHFSENRWKLIDPPAPAVDPVVAATAEVQRLLREQADAAAECDAAQDVLDKAEEKRRNIGKALTEAQRALDKANHDAAGVKYDDFNGVPQLKLRPIILDVANRPHIR